MEIDKYQNLRYIMMNKKIIKKITKIKLIKKNNYILLPRTLNPNPRPFLNK